MLVQLAILPLELLKAAFFKAHDGSRRNLSQKPVNVPAARLVLSARVDFQSGGWSLEPLHRNPPTPPTHQRGL